MRSESTAAVTPIPQPLLQVIVLRDGQVLSADILGPGSYTVGSSPDADLVLPERGLPAALATLHLREGRAVLQDTAGSALLTVNGLAITLVELHQGDEVRCGPFSVEVYAVRPKGGGAAELPQGVKSLLAKPPPLSARGASPQVPQAAARRQAPAPEPATTLVPVHEQPDQADDEPATEAAVAATSAAGARPRQGAKKATGAERREDAPPPLHAVKERTAVKKVQKTEAQYRVDAPPPLRARKSLQTENQDLAALLFESEPAEPAAHGRSARESKSPSGGRSEGLLPPPLRTTAKAHTGSALDIDVVLEAAGQAPLANRTRTKIKVPEGARKTITGHSPKPSKGTQHLLLELFWGRERQHAHSFSVDAKRPLLAQQGQDAKLPLWGFSLPADGPSVLAEPTDHGFRVNVPPQASVEVLRDGLFTYPRHEVKNDAKGRYVELERGQCVRLKEGLMSLQCTVRSAPSRPLLAPLGAVSPLLIALLGGFFMLFIAFAVAAGFLVELGQDHRPSGPPPVAVKLVMPPSPKPKKEEPKPEAEKEKAEKKKEVADKRPKPAPRRVEKAVAEVKQPPPAQTKAMKALEKLSAAGPAMGDMLAAVDKLGNGPGVKDLKADYKLSGMIGKAPIANAGLGTFGLGGGGGGGRGTLGMELLRGKGGGGIGALGAGGFGRSGTVGGTVSRATARSVAVQGTIDREAVARVVNSHLQEVRACYERALLRDPGLAGKVVLEWTLNTSGTVTTARTKSSTLKNGSVEGCILGSLRTWRFPPARGGQVIVSYPFLFNSVGY